MHDPWLIERGCIIDADFPEWVKASSTDVITSHYQIWAAHHKVVKKVNVNSNGQSVADNVAAAYHHLFPVSVYKHISQYKYNGGKWGLDKNTEISNDISMRGSSARFSSNNI